MTVLARVIDPDLRPVELTVERWTHIVLRHPELRDLQRAAMTAVEMPDHRQPGRRPNEQWFFVADVGPSSWLQTVVAYEAGRGFITTAFPRRRLP